MQKAVVRRGALGSPLEEWSNGAFGGGAGALGNVTVSNTVAANYMSASGVAR